MEHHATERTRSLRAGLKSPEKRIAVALDVPTEDELLRLVRALRGRVGLFKVGKELFCSLGPRAVEAVRAEGGEVFLDLKFHDIPNTVAGAVRSAARLGVKLLTLHCSGGREMLRAAAQAAAEMPLPPVLLGVTVLTSLDDGELSAVGLAGPVSDAVVRLGTLAVASGADGLVASPQEVASLRRTLGAGPLLVTPGVRPAGSDRLDQRRVATPGAAVAAGADLLVVGRPITQAPDPAAAADAIAAEIAEGI